MRERWTLHCPLPTWSSMILASIERPHHLQINLTSTPRHQFINPVWRHWETHKHINFNKTHLNHNPQSNSDVTLRTNPILYMHRDKYMYKLWIHQMLHTNTVIYTSGLGRHLCHPQIRVADHRLSCPIISWPLHNLKYTRIHLCVRHNQFRAIHLSAQTEHTWVPQSNLYSQLDTNGSNPLSSWFTLHFGVLKRNINNAMANRSGTWLPDTYLALISLISQLEIGAKWAKCSILETLGSDHPEADQGAHEAGPRAASPELQFLCQAWR